ncbi:IclR family transcriptional regulator [soil metagenome]
MVFPRTLPDPENAVRVLSRGLALIKAFCPRNLPMSNGDLASATGLPRPTVSRITATLTRLRYLDYLPALAQYQLGEAGLALGFGALSGLDIRLRARARMQRFADSEDLLVVLATRDDMAMVCHEVCRGRGALTIRVGVGSRLLLPHSAMGRAWISSLPAPAQRVVMDELKASFPREKLRGAMDEAAAQIKALGFCVTVSSLEPDVNSVATMVDFDPAPGHYVLGCSVPAFRYPPERCRDELGPRLLQLRSEIERDLKPAGDH